jgi:hypothetical protein
MCVCAEVNGGYGGGGAGGKPSERIKLGASLSVVGGQIVDSNGQRVDAKVVNDALSGRSEAYGAFIIVGGNFVKSGGYRMAELGFGMGGGFSSSDGQPANEAVQNIIKSDVAQQINTTFQQTGQAINNALGYGPEYDEQRKREAQQIIDNGGFGP